MSKLLQQIVAFYLLVFIVGYASTLQENPIIVAYPLIPCMLFASIYSHNTVHIQVSHVSKQKYNPWTRLLIMNLFALTLYIITSIFFK